MDFGFVRQRTAFSVRAKVRAGDTAQVVVTTMPAMTPAPRPQATEHQQAAAAARRARFAPDLAWPEDAAGQGSTS